MKKKPNFADIIEWKQNIPNVWNKAGVLETQYVITVIKDLIMSVLRGEKLKASYAALTV